MRLTLARFLALALEFQLGADFLPAAVAARWDAIGKLGAIAVIRTTVNYLLSREMQERTGSSALKAPDALRGAMMYGRLHNVVSVAWRARNCSVLILALSISGCASVGPTTVPRDRILLHLGSLGILEGADAPQHRPSALRRRSELR